MAKWVKFKRDDEAVATYLNLDEALVIKFEASQAWVVFSVGSTLTAEYVTKDSETIKAVALAIKATLPSSAPSSGPSAVATARRPKPHIPGSEGRSRRR